MAREKSEAKRAALLRAATEEIASGGLGASTAAIARRAGVAEGTLFTYFASKDELLNQLYLHLKQQSAAWLVARFPAGAPLKRRLQHIWKAYVAWALHDPQARRVSVLLHLSDSLRPEVRAAALEAMAPVHDAMDELQSMRTLRRLPPGTASTLMRSMQEWVLAAAAEEPARADRLQSRGFDLFWRAVQPPTLEE